MRAIIFLATLLIVPRIANAYEDALAYLYEPKLEPPEKLILQNLKSHAGNAEFTFAEARSQELVDFFDAVEKVNPYTQGQVIVNDGILRIAQGEYLLGLSIVERGMRILETKTNPFDTILIKGLMVKGISQLQLNSFTDAEDTFRRAQHITHRQRGVYNRTQLPIVSFVTATNIRQGKTFSADQQQRFRLKVAELNFGSDSIEILPTLIDIGSYFSTRGGTIPLGAATERPLEREILFKDAVNLYDRALKIIETNYGTNDLRLLSPLRGLAKARLLQMTQRKQAEAALLRSLSVIDSNPSSDLPDTAQAMVDLADLYVVTSNKKASEIYLDAWSELQENEETKQLASSIFGSPTRLHPQNLPFLYLNRQPDDTDSEEELFVLLNYSVSPEGRTREIKVLEKNVPNDRVRQVRQMLRGSRYRPRIFNGTLVETEALEFRQLFLVSSKKVDNAEEAKKQPKQLEEKPKTEELNVDQP